MIENNFKAAAYLAYYGSIEVVKNPKHYLIENPVKFQVKYGIVVPAKVGFALHVTLPMKVMLEIFSKISGIYNFLNNCRVFCIFLLHDVEQNEIDKKREKLQKKLEEVEGKLGEAEAKLLAGKNDLNEKKLELETLKKDYTEIVKIKAEFKAAKKTKLIVGNIKCDSFASCSNLSFDVNAIRPC